MLQIMPPDIENISVFRFYNLNGFNWMFNGSFMSADNNQQIVEGIALSFSIYSGANLDRVRPAIESVKNISQKNALLMLYTVKGSLKVHCLAIPQQSHLHQMFSAA